MTAPIARRIEGQMSENAKIVLLTLFVLGLCLLPGLFTGKKDNRPGTGFAAPKNLHGGSMDRKLVSAQDHEIEYLARKHGTTVEKVKQVIKQTGSRSRKEIDEALDKQFQHQPKKEHAE
jgi:hypothetical protein